VTRSRRIRGALRLARNTLALAVAALAGCLELNTDPDVPFSIQFDSLPWPSLLAGDSMRDSLGVVTPLAVRAYNIDGDLISGIGSGVGTSWFVLDTGASIDVDGIMTTTRVDGSVRVLGSVGGLQSPQRIIRIARRPDTLFTSQDTLVPFTYTLPDASTNLTPTLTVNLRTTDTIGGLNPGVNGWIVRWRAVHEGDTLDLNDVSMVTLQTAGGSRVGQDTTAADGASVRRLRIWANTLSSSIDSFYVVAEARLHGVAVSGSPVIFKVKVAPPSP
jgi:hypothetical protein